MREKKPCSETLEWFRWLYLSHTAMYSIAAIYIFWQAVGEGRTSVGRILLMLAPQSFWPNMTAKKNGFEYIQRNHCQNLEVLESISAAVPWP